MIERFVKWLKARQLRKAREDYAYWKAKRESLEGEGSDKSAMTQIFGMDFFTRRDHMEAAANEAKFMERVETLMREQ